VKNFRAVLPVLLLSALSGCALLQGPVENTAPQGRDAAALSGSNPAAGAQPQALASDYTVTSTKIVVPSYLKVSEANTLYPVADIVWRGDPYGDRRAQVKAIFEEAVAKAMPRLHGPEAVEADIVVRRFHSLTGHARFTVGGVHSITFVLTLRDSNSGQVVLGPRVVKADLRAFGGRKALQADRDGQTQKVRIIRHLADVIARELARPADNS